MENFLWWGTLMACLLASGCHGARLTESSTVAQQPCKIVDAERLRQGGKLLIIPFSANAQVEATTQSEQISLMIVKGIAETLKKSGGPFEILSADNASAAQLLLQGHIEEKSEKSQVKEWIHFENVLKLAVSLEIRETASQRRLAVMVYSLSEPSPKKDFLSLGYRLGKQIGQRLLTEIQLPAS